MLKHVETVFDLKVTDKTKHVIYSLKWKKGPDIWSVNRFTKYKIYFKTRPKFNCISTALPFHVVADTVGAISSIFKFVAY